MYNYSLMNNASRILLISHTRLHYGNESWGKHVRNVQTPQNSKYTLLLMNRMTTKEKKEKKKNLGLNEKLFLVLFAEHAVTHSSWETRVKRDALAATLIDFIVKEALRHHSELHTACVSCVR